MLFSSAPIAVSILVVVECSSEKKCFDRLPIFVDVSILVVVECSSETSRDTYVGKDAEFQSLL